MENFEKNKQFKILLILFIVVSIGHLLYASVTMRGLYMDGSFFMIEQLNNFSNGIYKPSFDIGHPRFFIMFLQMFPTMLIHFIFQSGNKFILMGIYSLTQFALPLLFLWWNYQLTKRTKRYDILFWSFFTYGVLICPYMIFSVVESIAGAILHFILWNYFVADIEYKKRDIFSIGFLILIMFATYEYVAVLGLIFFITHFFAKKKTEDFKKKRVITFIGWGSLFASIYNIVFMLKTEGESGEISRFLEEGIGSIPFLHNTNMIFSFITVVILALLIFKKEKITKVLIAGVVPIFVLTFVYLLCNAYNSINPMMEGHSRVYICGFLPILFLYLFIQEIFFKKINEIKYFNFICVVLICCIFQTLWQMVGTYYWNENVQYLKKELKEYNGLLYVPSEHEEISSFWNEKLRRYIWHGNFAAMGILFSPTYEQKTLLLNYDEVAEESNGIFRETLYVNNDKVSVPYGTEIDIKNKYWDLTECAKALDEYNNKNNIKTNG